MNDCRIGSLFSGYGGLDMGVQAVFGGTVAWHCDNDPAAMKALAHHWPTTPNLGDITAVDWRHVATTMPVDILTGGFPCQDLSAAGRRAGLAAGTRSGLWSHMAHAIHQLRPRYVVAENVRGILSAPADSDVEPCPWCVGDDDARPVRALGAVLGDLATLGYDAVWCGLRAADIGAPHSRYRVFILATDARHGGITERARQTRRDSRERAAERREPRRGRDAAASDTDGEHRDERRLPTTHETTSRRAHADTGRRGRTPPTHPDSTGPQRPEPAQRPQLSPRRAAAHPESLGRRTRNLGSRNPQERPEPDGDLVSAWGSYAPAIHRWATLRSCNPPAPTQPGHRAGPTRPVLSPAFVEWLQGLPAGHVTAVPGLTRAEQLKLLGNGVVPQQAAEGIRRALHHMTNN